MIISYLNWSYTRSEPDRPGVSSPILSIVEDNARSITYALKQNDDGTGTLLGRRCTYVATFGVVVRRDRGCCR